MKEGDSTWTSRMDYRALSAAVPSFDKLGMTDEIKGYDKDDNLSYIVSQSAFNRLNDPIANSFFKALFDFLEEKSAASSVLLDWVNFFRDMRKEALENINHEKDYWLQDIKNNEIHSFRASKKDSSLTYTATWSVEFDDAGKLKSLGAYTNTEKSAFNKVIKGEDFQKNFQSEDRPR